MLAAWRFPCCVMQALSDRCEPRGIIYSVVRNQDSWTHGVYSTLLSLLSIEVYGPELHCVCGFYPESYRWTRASWWSAGSAALVFSFLSISRKKVSLFGILLVLSFALVARCLWLLSNTISVLEKHPPFYYQSKLFLDKNSYLLLSDCFPEAEWIPLAFLSQDTRLANHSVSHFILTCF